jgi:NADH-quinone oxidoreductase subunit J
VTFEQALFWAFAATALGSAAGVVLSLRNAVVSALWLVLSMLALACLFVMLQAQFIGLIQVMVYAGAIVVLFLFVIMLLNLRGDATATQPQQPLLKGAAVVLCAGAAVQLATLIGALRLPWAEVPPEFGGTRALGLVLYTDYLLPVQLAGVLLLAGIVGAVVLAKRNLDG